MCKSESAYFKIILFLFGCLSLFAVKCNRDFKGIRQEETNRKTQEQRTKNIFKFVKGIKYTEVSRKFDNGLSFSPFGYQLEPQWQISFPSIDSVNIYSPRLGHFINAPVMFDHDSIFNIAWAWLKLEYINKDSIKFKVIHVDEDTIINEPVHVFMKFYSNNYIKKLHTTARKLWKPTVQDTLYIKTKTYVANKILDSAFAGTTPASIQSKSPLVTVQKETIREGDINGATYDNYMSPTYNIVIYNAFMDFSYSFLAYVDCKGHLTFWRSLTLLMPETRESIINTMKGITTGYLKYYLKIRPGSTLGIPHASIVFLNVVGF